MLVDPRPFTYEYRKPRIFNPTYQSRNLYESLYYRYPNQSNDYFPQPTPMRYEQPAQQPRDIPRNLSEPKRGHSFEIQPRQPPANRNPENKEQYKLPAISNGREQGISSAKAEYSLATMEGEGLVQKRRGFQRFRIYERQQKPFDIINCFPKESDNNRLRNFPKLTLEDKLLQRGSYHTFQQEKF